MKYRSPIEVLKDEKHRLIGEFYDQNFDKRRKNLIKKGAHVSRLERQSRIINKAIEVLRAFEDDLK